MSHTKLFASDELLAQKIARYNLEVYRLSDKIQLYNPTAGTIAQIQDQLEREHGVSDGRQWQPTSREGKLEFFRALEAKVINLDLTNLKELFNAANANLVMAMCLLDWETRDMSPQRQTALFDRVDELGGDIKPAITPQIYLEDRELLLAERFRDRESGEPWHVRAYVNFGGNDIKYMLSAKSVDKMQLFCEDDLVKMIASSVVVDEDESDQLEDFGSEKPTRGCKL